MLAGLVDAAMLQGFDVIHDVPRASSFLHASVMPPQLPRFIGSPENRGFQPPLRP